MPGRWPYQGDSPLAIARRVAQAYRAHLHTVSPGVCAGVDDMVLAYGQRWIIPQVVTVDDAAELSPSQAADYLCVSTAAIRRLRASGRLKGTEGPNGWRYLVADLRQLQSSPRRRSPKAVPHDA